MRKNIVRSAIGLAIAALLIAPGAVFAKPSVSADNYKQKQTSPPPAQQQSPAQQDQMYNSNMGSDGLAQPASVPPSTPPEAVPEPMTLILFGLGVAGAGVATRMRKRAE